MDSPQLIEEIPPPALPPMEVDPPSIRDRKHQSPFRDASPPTIHLIIPCPALSDQAFAQMHLTGSADLEEEDFQIFTWRLKDYRSLPKKLSSDKFMCGGHEWWVFPSFSRFIGVGWRSRRAHIAGWTFDRYRCPPGIYSSSRWATTVVMGINRKCVQFT